MDTVLGVKDMQGVKLVGVKCMRLKAGRLSQEFQREMMMATKVAIVGLERRAKLKRCL